MLLEIRIISAILTVALVTANLNKNLTSSQPLLESTNTFNSNGARVDEEEFALYELALAFPHLMTLSGEFPSSSYNSVEIHRLDFVDCSNLRRPCVQCSNHLLLRMLRNDAQR